MSTPPAPSRRPTVTPQPPWMIVGVGVVLEHVALAAGRADQATPAAVERQDLLLRRVGQRGSAGAVVAVAGSNVVDTGAVGSIVVVGAAAGVACGRRRWRSCRRRHRSSSGVGASAGRSGRRARTPSGGCAPRLSAAVARRRVVVATVVAGRVRRCGRARARSSSWSVVSMPSSTHCSTGRRYTWPVTWTSSIASCWLSTPGRLTTIASPWRRISGSETPRLSTRSRIRSTARSSAAGS